MTNFHERKYLATIVPSQYFPPTVGAKKLTLQSDSQFCLQVVVPILNKTPKWELLRNENEK